MSKIFFQMECPDFDFRTGEKLPAETKWFWDDGQCEEPIGPFDTREEAEADYHNVRGE